MVRGGLDAFQEPVYCLMVGTAVRNTQQIRLVFVKYKVVWLLYTPPRLIKGTYIIEMMFHYQSGVQFGS